MEAARIVDFHSFAAYVLTTVLFDHFATSFTELVLLLGKATEDASAAWRYAGTQFLEIVSASSPLCGSLGEGARRPHPQDDGQQQRRTHQALQNVTTRIYIGCYVT